MCRPSNMRSKTLAWSRSQWVRFGWLGSALFVIPGCSIILPFEECERDEHCLGEGAVCVSGVCTADDDGEIVVSGLITADVVWSADALVRLSGPVFVAPGTTLTIEAGVRVLGERGSALIVQRGATLRAYGTRAEPVVFSSAQRLGERYPGDWGGVALLGDAPVNVAGATLEGVTDPSRAGYGGADAAGSCGVLEFVRIEFAGFAIEQDNELNGLTLAGCGSGTLVDHVHVHLGKDDGVEIFGGTVNLRHVVVTRAQDDSIDWDQGWTGNAQFVAIVQDAAGDNAIEASSNSSDPQATPRSEPQLWNVTLIGSGGEGSQRAMTFKEGTGGVIANAVVTGHSIEAIDIVGEATAALLESESLLVASSMFYQIGPGGEAYFPGAAEEPAGGSADDDMGFDEQAFFLGREDLVLGRNPGLNGAFNLSNPGWVPQTLEVQSVGQRPPVGLFDRFDEQASYAGAFPPGESLSWTQGWTAYPVL